MLTARTSIQWYLPINPPEPTRLKENDYIVLLCVDHNIIVSGEYLEDKESGCQGQFYIHGGVNGDVTHWTWLDKSDCPSLETYQKD